MSNKEMKKSKVCYRKSFLYFFPEKKKVA